MFGLHNTACGTHKTDIDNEDVIDSEDVIDLKNEPVEVSDCILWVCEQFITNVFANLKREWFGTVI